MKRTSTTGLDSHQTAFVKLAEANSRRHRKHEVFRDFCALAALSFSNSVDLKQYEKREAQYMQIVGKYEREEVERFPQMLAHLTESLSEKFHDALGQIFMAMELGDHWKGQFFTPYSVALMMGQMTTHDVEGVIAANGFFTVNDPAVGAGAMVIGLAESVKDRGINYQQAMHVTAQDIDETAVHMAYIQLSLLHIPAVVIHGNSLWPEQTWGHWHTPAHVLGMWDFRLSRNRTRHADSEDRTEPVTPLSEPVEQCRIATAPVVIAPTLRISANAEQLSLFG